MIVKIQVIINVDPQKFISYRAAWDLNFQVLFRVDEYVTLFSVWYYVIVMKPSKKIFGVFLKFKNDRIKVWWTGTQCIAINIISNINVIIF